MTYEEMEPVVESHRSRLHIVRKQVPLTMHPHARDAARAECCGEQLGKGDEMADALFTAEVDDLTPAGCEKIAQRLGLPLDAYRACVQNPATDASIEADKAEFKAAGGYALPTIWVDETPMVGARPREDIAKVVHDALAKLGG
jgi:2-hydroxychromene-2-carboxylate isomerase